MTPHDKNEEQDLAHHWDPLDPEVKKAVRNLGIFAQTPQAF